MFLLETNVVAGLHKARAGKPTPLSWPGAAGASAAIFGSAITIQELETGVLLVERCDARQGAVLRRWLETQVLPMLVERHSAGRYRRRPPGAGVYVRDPRRVRDSLIAATAPVHRMPVVTPSGSDFPATGVEIIGLGDGPTTTPVS
jgi:predicted nucleic acid-binding protein